MKGKSPVFLRALEPTDYKTTIRWRNDAATNSLLGGVTRYVSEAYEEKWVRDAIFCSPRAVRLAVCLSDGGRHIGNVYMTDIDEMRQSCTSHIIIGESNCRGLGYGTAALREAVEYMFRQRNIFRIQALVLEHNTGSLRLHERLGYRREGLLRHTVYKDGSWHNQVLLSLLRDEYAMTDA